MFKQFKRLALLIITFVIMLFPLWSENIIAQKFNLGMEYFNQGEYKKAIKKFKRIIKKHSKVSDLGRVQAQIGKSFEKLGKYKKAFESYELIFSKYLDYPYPEEIVKRQYDIANSILEDENKSFLGIDFSESDKFALKILQRVVQNAPFGVYAEKAMLTSIKLQVKMREFEETEKLISEFRKNYENSDHLEEVSYIHATLPYLQSLKADYDQSSTLETIERIDYYNKTYFEGTYKSELDKMLQEMKDRKSKQDWKTALFYLNNNNQGGAKRYLEQIINENPDSDWGNKATTKLDKVNLSIENDLSLGDDNV